MAQMTNVIAVIPARGGSKGLKGKNLRLICNLPLIDWSIIAAKKSKIISKIVVTRDDQAILDSAILNEVSWIERPTELATDFAASEEVLKHTLALYRNFSVAVLLQPTSILRNTSHIDEALGKFLASESMNSMISVYEMDNKALKSFYLSEHGCLIGIRNCSDAFIRRQDLPKLYQSNGAIYIVRVNKFLTAGSFLIDPCEPYLMDRESSLDIDSEEDLKLAKESLNQCL
jgi:CMP-N,N'-diacetyllegionaminic acid synthase